MKHLKQIKDTKYFITDNGIVFNSKNLEDKSLWRKLKPFKINSGYLYVTINKKNYAVHHLVYSTFEGTIGEKETINHKDFDTCNNKLSNLEITTYKEQISHYLQSTGREIYTIKLTLSNGLTKSFETFKEVSDYLGCNRGSIGYYMKKGFYNGIKFEKVILDSYK